MKKLLMALAIPALLTACSEDKKPQKPGQDGLSGWGLWMQEAPVLTIKSADGKSVAGAQVLIGDALNSPFSRNFLVADANGLVTLPEAWTTAETVTVQAPGYVRVTYFNQEPSAMTIVLRPATSANQFEVAGTTSGQPIKDKDGIVDFGLVIPAFSKVDLMRFDINKVISPQMDKFSTLGQEISVPSNISLPTQKESYGLFTVTLDKPQYRVYYPQAGVNRVFAARGRFPFKATIEGLRGGAQFYELINNFKINGGAIRDIEIKDAKTRLNMPTQELQFTDKRSLKAPTFRADELFIAASVANQSGLYIPTDFKKIETGKAMELSLLPNTESMLLGVMMKSEDMKKSVDRMSATLIPFAADSAPQMLPLIPDPAFANGELILPKITTIEGVNPIATYTVLSKLDEVQQGAQKVKIYNPMWEVYAHNWIETMKLPQWPDDVPVAGKKRWEVNFIGSQKSSQSRLGPAMIEDATHVTHSSVSFQ